MLKPLANFMIVEKYNELEGVILPDSIKPQTGDLFTVISVGPGWLTDDGKRVPPEVTPGDIVALVGKILRIPHDNKESLLARIDDAIAIKSVISDKI